MTDITPEQPAFVPPAQPKPRTNVLALLGFIFGIVSVFLFTIFLPAIAGLVLSIIGLVKSRELGQRALAIWGVCLSGVALLLGISIGGAALTAFFNGIDPQPTLDGKYVSKQIKEKSSDPSIIKSVECPAHPLQKAGTSFHCILTGIDGSTALTTVNVEDDQGDITWSSDR